MLLLLQRVGWVLEINGVDAEIRFTRPQLPAGCGELHIRNLEVAGETVDLLLVGQGQDVAVRELRRGNAVRVVAL